MHMVARFLLTLAIAYVILWTLEPVHGFFK